MKNLRGLHCSQTGNAGFAAADSARPFSQETATSKQGFFASSVSYVARNDRLCEKLSLRRFTHLLFLRSALGAEA